MGRFYLTTPIYYVNAAPHIGHAYTTLIGDAVTRWHRLLGDDVHFLTGTDEHGLKIQRAAEASGQDPEVFAAAVAEQFKQTWRELGIAYDDFIRTTEPRHYAGVEKLLQACYDAGDIELGTYEGLYCVSCEAYYTEADLVDGKCPIHARPVELVTEENYFFKLSRYEQRLLDWYAEHPGSITPTYRLNEALGFIRGGLQDFSISRQSITWGIPLPWDPKHVAYVWFDALANYITAVGYGTDPELFEKWWPRTSCASTVCTGRRCCCRPVSNRRGVGRSTGSSSSAAKKCRRRLSTRSPPPTSSPTSVSTASVTTC